MSTPEIYALSRDSFLEPLGLIELADRLQGPEQLDQLYGLAVRYATERKLVEPELAQSGSAGTLPFKVPGTPVTVRLSQPSKQELSALLVVACLVLTGTAPVGLEELGVTGLLALVTRTSQLRKQYGELSIVEAMAQADPSTSDQITLLLFGHPCRHPEAGCRFMDAESGTCAIQRAQVEQTLQFLEERKQVRRMNAVAPHEYAVVW